MAFSSGSPSSLSAAPNVTPLIDVLLVLLIIFMVITPVREHGLEANLPQPAAGTAPTPHELPVIVRVHTTAGEISYQLNGEALRSGELLPRMAALFARRQDRVLFVAADRALEYGSVAHLISLGHLAGVKDVAILKP